MGCDASVQGTYQPKNIHYNIYPTYSLKKQVQNKISPINNIRTWQKSQNQKFYQIPVSATQSAANKKQNNQSIYVQQSLIKEPMDQQLAVKQNINAIKAGLKNLDVNPTFAKENLGKPEKSEEKLNVRRSQKQTFINQQSILQNLSINQQTISQPFLINQKQSQTKNSKQQDNPYPTQIQEKKNYIKLTPLQQIYVKQKNQKLIIQYYKQKSQHQKFCRPKINKYFIFQKQIKKQQFNFDKNFDIKELKFISNRGSLQICLKEEESFINHHLKHQMTLTKYAQADIIKRRQIVQHNKFEELLHRVDGVSNAKDLTKYGFRSYLQRIMLEAFQAADKQFFEEGKSYDQVRRTIAQRYLFQIHQIRQFMDAGTGKLDLSLSKMPMRDLAENSDFALYSIFNYLKQKYPHTADHTTIQFPWVKQKKIDVNLLDNFPSKCYSSPTLINIQTLFSDLQFLIDRSIQEFLDFQKDMKAMLGQDVLTDLKIKKVKQGSQQQYGASSVRRIFIKWVQTIVERISDVILSEAFLNFVQQKNAITQNFYFKSTIQPNSHVRVIQCICQLLQTAKYDISNLTKRKQFGFYIYDLLKCKTKRKNGEQICQLLRKMEDAKTSPSGKKFEVVRIKNRFKTSNRDLIVNFRYGDVIVAQAQLCVDTSDVSQKIRRTNKFNHYIQQLQKGLFGPTVQLIMQYEDFQRTNASINLRSSGSVKKRTQNKNLIQLKRVDRKCFNGHEMIQVKGNLQHLCQIKQDELLQEVYIQKNCDHCGQSFALKEPYHYCYYCATYFCTPCKDIYNTRDIKQFQLRCNSQNVVIQLRNQQQLMDQMGKASIVIFYLKDSAPSTVLLDFVAYSKTVSKMRGFFTRSVFKYCINQKDSKQIRDKYNLKEFPTTIVFDTNLTSQTAFVGALWILFEKVYHIQDLLKFGGPKNCQEFCCNNLKYKEVSRRQDQELKCKKCLKSGQPDEVYYLGQNKKKAYYCEIGHHTCSNCALLIDRQPTIFKCYQGSSYLACKLQNELKLLTCSAGHPTTHVLASEQAKQLKCGKCLLIFTFHNLLGAGYCSQCKQYHCPKCINIQEKSLKQIREELASQTVQDTAQQYQKCLCNQFFKKVYNTRKYGKITDSQFNGMEIILNQKNSKHWKCFICKRKIKDGQLHLACFYCKTQELKKINKNLQICLQCAIWSDFTNKKIQKKISGIINVNFLCKKNHPYTLTKQFHKTSQTVFQCIECKEISYIYTERYCCKYCNENVCLSCSKQKYKNQVQTSRKCGKNSFHQLVAKEASNTLTSCSCCRIIIRDFYFACSKNCKYNLCLNCSSIPSDVSDNQIKKNRIGRQEKQLIGKYIPGYPKQLMNLLNNIESDDEQINEIQDQDQIQRENQYQKLHQNEKKYWKEHQCHSVAQGNTNDHQIWHNLEMKQFKKQFQELGGQEQLNEEKQLQGQIDTKDYFQKETSHQTDDLNILIVSQKRDWQHNQTSYREVQKNL